VQVRAVAPGTWNIDYNGRFCMSSAAAARARAFGVDLVDHALCAGK